MSIDTATVAHVALHSFRDTGTGVDERAFVKRSEGLTPLPLDVQPAGSAALHQFRPPGDGDGSKAFAFAHTDGTGVIKDIDMDIYQCVCDVCGLCM